MAHHEVVEHVDEVVALVAAHAPVVAAAVPRERARPPVQHGRQRVGEHVVVAEELEVRRSAPEDSYYLVVVKRPDPYVYG